MGHMIAYRAVPSRWGAVKKRVARQIRTPASILGLYGWSGRTIERHRREIRDHLGFRECSVPDADKLTDWLAVNVAHAVRQSGASA
ncbi:DUF4158 domain-containing protein [Nonomuraea sp. NPDC049141]|uniref:DUF4158 domain-containing protein n=1 Tax=Nonomuraea sp. NPDC049141 TaxID=3155500 RepID=UPI0033C8C1CF